MLSSSDMSIDSSSSESYSYEEAAGRSGFLT